MQMKEITQLDEDIYKMQYPVENIEALTVIGKILIVLLSAKLLVQE